MDFNEVVIHWDIKDWTFVFNKKYKQMKPTGIILGINCSLLYIILILIYEMTEILFNILYYYCWIFFLFWFILTVQYTNVQGSQRFNIVWEISI